MTTLTAHQNQYAGIIIDADCLPATTNEFRTRLDDSIKHWRDENLALVWLSLTTDHAELIPVAIEAGFEFHHCTANQLTLTLALQTDAYIPHYARHCIGAGAVIISPRNELLTVLEKNDVVDRPKHYKLPGGMLEPGEHIAAAVLREVLEETGIKTRFENLLGFRHHHRGQFGTSNMYLVCRLTPLTLSIDIDTTEIAAARWVPVDDYLADEAIGLLNKHMVTVALGERGFVNHSLDGYMGGDGDYEVFSV